MLAYALEMGFAAALEARTQSEKMAAKEE